MKKLLLFLFLIPTFVKADFVTYTKSGGRFGDNLLAYMHAKWASYKYNVPLGYYPFDYSDQLVLDQLEIDITPLTKNKGRYQYIQLDQNNSLDEVFQFKSSKPLLFIIPYFTESQCERALNPKTPYFEVDWNDIEFKSLLKKMISPKKPIPPLELPKNKTTVALHIRTGGGFDNVARERKKFPLKFPSMEFYKKAIDVLYESLNRTPLYVQIFTDDKDPLSLEEELQSYFCDKNIDWHCRIEDNRWHKNVLEDFFALTQFDCAIHGESNFSLCAGKIADYKIEIVPLAKGIGDEIDQIAIFGSDSATIRQCYEIWEFLNFLPKSSKE